MKTSDKNGLMYIIPIVGIIIFVIIIFVTKGTDGHQCNQYYPIYDQEIKGEISNIYVCEDNLRMGGCLDIIQKDKKYTFKRFLQSETTYSSLKKKDSVIKLANSYSFRFYRDKEHIGHIDYPCSPPNSKNK